MNIIYLVKFLQGKDSKYFAIQSPIDINAFFLIDYPGTSIDHDVWFKYRFEVISRINSSNKLIELVTNGINNY